MKPIRYGQQRITRQDIEAVVSALDSAFLTTGPYVEKFEEALCRLTGAKYAVACCNATAALHIACLSLNLNRNFLGLTSPITFVASSNCFEFSGGRSDFIDIDRTTRCISVERLHEYCKKIAVPDVVVPVSFAGIVAPLGEIKELSNQFGFRIIEDAAHSLGSTYCYQGSWHSSGSCSHSDLAVFSFHAVKTITTGEGGAVLTNDPELASRLRSYRSHGIYRDAKYTPIEEGNWYYQMIDLGYNYRITDIQCALGLSQLERLQKIRERRLKIIDYYRDTLAPFDVQSIPKFDNQCPCYHLAVVEFPHGSIQRKMIYNELGSKYQIHTQVHYVPVYWQPYYVNKYGFEKRKCPNAEAYYEGCLSLPVYEDLSDEELSYVGDSVQSLLVT